MNVKIISFLVLTFPVLAGAGPAPISSRSSECIALLKEPKPVPGSLPANPQLKECEALQTLAKINEASLTTERDIVASTDKRITCFRKAGYTMDYESCKTAVNAYNWVGVAEQGMFTQNKVRMDMKNKALEKDVASRMAEGDGQNAVIDASIAQHNQLKQMNYEQAAAYGAAVGVLGTALAAWKSDADGIQNKKCKGDLKCIEAVMIGVKAAKDEVIANDAAKNALKVAAMEYFSKGVKAGITAKMMGDIENKLGQAKTNFTDDEMVKLERCALNPADPACVLTGSRLAVTPNYQSGEFSVGNGDVNSFGTKGSDQAFGEEGAPTTPVSSGDRVADVTSPFKDEAKAANNILNPAGAATVQPGGAAGGAGGGGGGGSGGGGSASLGNDLQGVDTDPNKQAEVKANKVAGSYGSSGGKGFSAIKGSGGKSEDENPFAGLFDKSNGSGGIEEDRSIASGDIDGGPSGLFEKISKRYGQIQADKRIEANNLE